MSLARLINYRAMVAADEEGVAGVIEDLDAINRVLVDNGLRRHEERSSALDYTIRSVRDHLGTSWLHHLRQLQAHVLQDPGWRHTPCGDDDEPWNDEAIDRELTVYMRSHLIIHADTQGYYVPVDFADVLYGLPKGECLPRVIACSPSCNSLRPGVALDERGSLSDGEAWRVASTSEDDPAFREKLAWLLLFECARNSVSS